MKKMMTLCAAALAVLSCAIPLQAHHSGSMYDPTMPLWLEGTVIRFEGIDPHTIITLEERSADGQVRHWAVEGPSQTVLNVRGSDMSIPEVGDVIKFCAFPYKSREELSRLFPEANFSGRRTSPDADGSSPEFVWGHVMVTSEGEKQLWNPHGMLSQCIRSSDDQRQSWLDFLDSDRDVRRAWCEQRGYTQILATESLREFVEETNSLLDEPCE